MPNPHTLNHCLFAKLNYCLCPFLPSYSSHNHPPFPTLGFLPSHLQEHPLPPQPRRTITGSANPSLSNSAATTWATHRHRNTQPCSAASRLPLSCTPGGASIALPCQDARRWQRCFCQPRTVPCFGYFCSECHFFKPRKYEDPLVGKAVQLLGTGMAAGQDSHTALLHPRLRNWEMSLQTVLQPEEKAVLLTCTAHCPNLLLCSLCMGYKGDGPLKEH